MRLDKDLASIQEARDLIGRAKAAQKILAEYDQRQVDNLVAEIARETAGMAGPLAEQAAKETGFGIVTDKIAKNLLASQSVYEFIKDMKTIGVIAEDKEKKILEVASPVGVIAALIPSTNPTSTVIFKALISIKAGNAVVFSPHPNALACITETVKIIREAIGRAGGPEDLALCLATPTFQATDALMKHPDTGLILATGGPGMVKAAYSSGTPAIGVGAGNGPAFIERSADIPRAVKHIFDSKTFDNGTICASEQSIVTERSIREKVLSELQKQGGYILKGAESDRVGAILMRGGGMNPAIVGRSAVTIAEMAGVEVPPGTRVLISEEDTVGHENPYSREKLCPVLGFYVEEDWESACRRCIEILQGEGLGHTMVIHSMDETVIRAFALKKPVMRLLVNTPAALGGVGASTNLAPSFTLGCGAPGGNSTSDNVTPMNLLNIRRVAWGVRELEEIRQGPQSLPDTTPKSGFGREEIERITRQVIQQMAERKG